MVRAVRSVLVVLAAQPLFGCIDDFECGDTANTSCGALHPDGTDAELGATYCGNVRESPCGTPGLESECLARLDGYAADVVRDGCENELHEYLRCAAGSPIECSTTDSVPPVTSASVADPRCKRLRTAFRECVTWVGGECGVSFGVGAPGGLISCGVGCEAFASECEGASQNGPVACTCTEGPNAGVVFDAADCSSDLIYQTGHTCRY
ncbi:MAG TPA: hypothetical protein VFZ53_04145 [Polyangiaceae bacterium]